LATLATESEIIARLYELGIIAVFAGFNMSVPPIAKATLQATIINAGANVLAQAIKAYRNDVSVFLHQFSVVTFFDKAGRGQRSRLMLLQLKCGVDVAERCRKETRSRP
jgi:hypothetical protein